MNQILQIKEFHKNYNYQICQKNILEIAQNFLKSFDVGELGDNVTTIYDS